MANPSLAKAALSVLMYLNAHGSCSREELHAALSCSDMDCDLALSWHAACGILVLEPDGQIKMVW
jgi:hypothetical protein